MNFRSKPKFSKVFFWQHACAYFLGLVLTSSYWCQTYLMFYWNVWWVSVICKQDNPYVSICVWSRALHIRIHIFTGLFPAGIFHDHLGKPSHHAIGVSWRQGDLVTKRMWFQLSEAYTQPPQVAFYMGFGKCLTCFMFLLFLGGEIHFQSNLEPGRTLYVFVYEYIVELFFMQLLHGNVFFLRSVAGDIFCEY